MHSLLEQSVFFGVAVSIAAYEAGSLGQFTRNYTQTTKRGLLTTNKG